MGRYTPGGGSEGVCAGPAASGELLEKQILGSTPDILSQAQTVDLDLCFNKPLGWRAADVVPTPGGTQWPLGSLSSFPTSGDHYPTLHLGKLRLTVEL